MPRRVLATRYVTPLREGGSLPALVEADDDGLYVLKFRGAGQGPLVLVAEQVVGMIGQALGLPVPELVGIEVPPGLGRAEPDPEIQDLLRASPGLNLGMDFLPGSLAFDPGAPPGLDAELAAAVVWLDALTTNVDRTARNPNMLVWHGRLWLIDHGAALFRHHAGTPVAPAADRPFPQIAQHVLLPWAGPVDAAHDRLAPRLDAGTLAAILATVPDEWLGGGPLSPAERRADYVAYLARRLETGDFAREAEDARRGA